VYWVSDRPRLLYISPVVPSATGNGLAMRAGAVLRALARHYRVTLLVVPLYAPRRGPIPGEIVACTEQVVRLGEGAPLSPRQQFDIVHVFRLAALPYAEPWLHGARERRLDLDDVESVSRRRIAALFRSNGDEAAAGREEHAAGEARRLEHDTLRRFDRVYVCSETDRQALRARGRGRAEIAVLPNSLPLPATTPSPPPAEGPRTLLFVGTLGYYPNEDAARYFCTEILPHIQAATDRPVAVRIVGSGAGSAVRHLAALPIVQVSGNVPDVAPWYRDAHVAIAPMRAGGGTRIKVLEAFAQRRPLVATTIGMEGIAADGRHALIADEPEAFARACLRLLCDEGLAERIASEAFALFSDAYSDERLARTIAALATAPRRQGPPAAGARPAPN
jgi:glycosyltransferase involved in cell wall biosynthesis